MSRRIRGLFFFVLVLAALASAAGERAEGQRAWQHGIDLIRVGHSGHVTAMGDRFLVAYGEGWVERGGFLDRGTGKPSFCPARSREKVKP